jgi:hypothetical protein
MIGLAWRHSGIISTRRMGRFMRAALPTDAHCVDSRCLKYQPNRCARFFTILFGQKQSNTGFYSALGTSVGFSVMIIRCRRDRR